MTGDRRLFVLLATMFVASLVGCGEPATPPAANTSAKDVRAKLDSANAETRIEGAKEAKEKFGSGNASNSAQSSPPEATK